ncbi:MAG: DUF3368 domain-containing protein [Ignavibacteriae bacterium]|nr:DUF3368 domain-containing protein [Ignavibacteriota bacterium]
MIVISDASPILNLSAVGKLDILPRLFTSVIIPQAVFEEIALSGKGKPGAAELAGVPPWAEVLPCHNSDLFKELSMKLDRGEAEAIALAVESKADLLLIDEKRGRATARSYQIRVTGLLGVLLQAKRKGILSEIKSTLDEMRLKANFRVSDKMYEQILSVAGELNG